jgi:hypothetical protein
MSDGMNESRRIMVPVPGEVMTHFKGNKYIYIGRSSDSGDVGNRDKDMAIYMNMETGQIYHRNYKEFLSPKEHDNGFRETRFKQTGTAELRIDGRKGETYVTIKL